MKIISHVYDTYAQASAAVHDLEAAGFATSDISLVANKYVTAEYADVKEVPTSPTGAGAGIGAGIGGGAGLLAGLGLLAIPGLGPVVAAGWAAAAAVGAVAGGAAGAGIGGLVSVLQDSGVDANHAHVYSEAVRRGGTLVTARVPDTRYGEADAIMMEHSPINPQVRGDEYRTDGWENFDPKAPAYKLSETQIERIRNSSYM